MFVIVYWGVTTKQVEWYPHPCDLPQSERAHQVFSFISGYGQHTGFHTLSNILVPTVFVPITCPVEDPSKIGLKEKIGTEKSLPTSQATDLTCSCRCFQHTCHFQRMQESCVSAPKAREAVLLPVPGESSKADCRDFESGISFTPNHMLGWNLLVTCVGCSSMGQKVELSGVLCKYKYPTIGKQQLPFLCGNCKQENKIASWETCLIHLWYLLSTCCQCNQLDDFPIQHPKHISSNSCSSLARERQP